jgi:multidrug efflux system outer membrane protein
MNKILFGAVSVAAAVLAGCTVGPDYTRPQVYVPEVYRSVPGQTDVNGWLDSRWWTQYGSQPLDTLVSAALAHNRTLQQSLANVEKAAAALTVSRADLFPQLGYSGAAERNRASENTLTGASLQGRPYNSYQAAASVQWEVDLWGKIRRQTESASATLRAAQAAHRAALVSVVGSTVTTYITVLQTDEQIRIARETAESYKQTYELFRLRLKYGNLSEMEVVQAKSQWKSAEVQIPALEQQRSELINSLSILTGLDAARMKLGTLSDLSLPVIAKGVPSKLLEDSPDVVEAEEQLIAANADIGAAKAAYFPSISLSGDAGFASSELHELIRAPSKVWSVQGSLTGPIFRWGAVAAGVRSAEAEKKAAEAAYQLAVMQAFADVDNALSAREKLMREAEEKTSLVMSLRDYKRLAHAQYEGGYTGYVTVLQAEQSLLPQELSLAEVKASSLMTAAKIYQALGGGWIDKALTEELGKVQKKGGGPSAGN